MSNISDSVWRWISLIIIIGGFIATNVYQETRMQTLVEIHLGRKDLHVDEGEFVLKENEKHAIHNLALKGYPFTQGDRQALSDWVSFNKNWEKEVQRIVEKTIIAYEKQNR